MAPQWRRLSLDPGADFREAAVLALLYQEAERLVFPLIVRSEGPGPHSGQVAFPGGAVEGGETFVQAALREAREEIGLATDGVEVLGKLTPFGVNSSRFRITPVVAFLPERPCLTPSPAEVAEWFPVSIEELLDAGSKGTALVRHGAEEKAAPCYRFSGRVVWGATAIALAELEEVLRRAEAGIG